MRLASVLVLVALMGESARACPGAFQHRSCLDDRRATPEDGATGVSPDAKIWISDRIGPGKVTLLGPEGTRELGVVPAVTDQHVGEQFRFDPGRLEPAARYTVHVDGYGDVTSFMTAKEPWPVDPPTIRRFEVAEVTYGNGQLPSDYEADLDLAIPDEAVAVELTLRDAEHERTLRAPRDAWYAIVSEGYYPPFTVDVEATTCLDVTAIDIDENRSPTMTRCVTGTVRTHDEWFALRFAHPTPMCHERFEPCDIIEVVDDSPPGGLPWLLAMVGFAITIGRTAWHTRQRKASRAGEAIVVERAAQRALVISRLVVVAVAAAVPASFVWQPLSSYLPCLFGLGMYDVIRYSRARYVVRAARTPGATCAISDTAVAVDDTWLHVGRRTIEHAETPAIPPARAMK